jgi:hypothetical protein
MASLNRWERLQLAAARLRQIHHEAAAIYRSFPELDRRPKIRRGLRPRTTGHQTRVAVRPAKLH